MITEWLLHILSNFAQWALGLIPETCCGVPVGEIPGWIAGAKHSVDGGGQGGGLAGLWGQAAQLGAWIPWDNVKMFTVCLLTVIVVSFIIRQVRMLMTIVPFVNMGAG